MKYPNLWSMLFNAPLMLHEPVAQHFADMFVLIQERGLAAAQALAASSVVPQPHAYADNVAVSRYKQKPYSVTDSGVALLPVHGVLVQRAGQISPDCTELTSYQRLDATFRAMLADPDVRGILMEHDSPGGQVAGNFGLANDILQARNQKPIWAYANAMSFSASYSLLSAAERAFAPIEAMVGSIGVIMQHVNQAEKDRKAGMEYTVIKSGANKDMLNSHKPLSEADQAWAQAEVDRTRNLFAQIVAAGRGLDLKSVLDTEASIYGAPDGRAMGLIDDVATFTETLAAFEQRLNAGSAFVFTPAGSAAAQLSLTHQQESLMSGNASAANPAPAANQPVLAAPVPASIATPAVPSPAAVAVLDNAAATASAATAERARIQGITGSAEAVGREGLAQHLAFNTGMTVDEAVKVLSASAKGGIGLDFKAAMSTVPNPKVGVDGQASGEPVKPSINTADIYARRAAASVAATR